MLAEYQQQTDTRFITSGYKGTEVLNNTYGCLNRLLKQVLVQGYNKQPIESLIIKDSVIELRVPLNHGFVTNQVVSILDTSIPLLKGEYRILTTDGLILTIAKPEGLDSNSVYEAGSFVQGSPLGYSIVYENNEEGVVCYKNSSTRSPAILKVIDKLPPNGYDISWSKYARVTVGQEINNEGNFVEDFKAPYHPDFPDAENTGNKIVGAGGVHGFAKWIYSLGHNYENIETRVPSGVFPNKWRIIGDSTSFYLMIHTTGLPDLNYSYDLVGFGNYVSYNDKETTNVCLQAKDGFIPANSNDRYSPTRPRSYFGSLNYDYSGFILTDVYGMNKSNYNRCRSIGNYLGNNPTKPWANTDTQSINPITGSWLMSNLIIKDSDNFIRGEYRGIKILYGLDRLSDLYITPEGDISLYVQEPMYNSSFITVPMIFSLKNWEKII